MPFGRGPAFPDSANRIGKDSHHIEAVGHLGTIFGVA